MTRTATLLGPRAFALAVLGSATLLAACGGGSGHHDSAPQISALADQVVNQDTTAGPITVAITPGSAPITDVTVSAAVADTVLVPPAGVSLDGSGAARTLTLTPATDATGTTAVTVTVKDSLGHASSRVFRLTVNPVYASFTQYATATFQADSTSMPQPVSGLTFQPDADGNDAAFAAFLQ